MFTFPRGLLLLACLVAVPCSYANDESAMPTSDTLIQPPVATKHPHTIKKHGDVRVRRVKVGVSPRGCGPKYVPQ